MKELLKKYISGKTDKDDFTKLKYSASLLSDRELDNILSEVWEEYEGVKQLNDFDSILTKIQPQKKSFRLSRLITVAACLFTGIMIGVQIYFYQDNKRLNNFISNEIVMSVESGERTNITLPDGTKVALNTGTTLSYPVEYGLTTRDVKLDGEAFMEVVKNREKPFRVYTEFIEIEVLGTTFNINAYSTSETIETTLIDGSIQLTTKGKKEQSVIMKPNEKAIYNRTTGLLSVTQKSSSHFETAWLEGKLVFRSVGLEDILRKLEKRYGVTIEIVNMEKYNTDLFSGSFREDYVNGVLRILQLHYNFTYTDSFLVQRGHHPGKRTNNPNNRRRKNRDHPAGVEKRGYSRTACTHAHQNR